MKSDHDHYDRECRDKKLTFISWLSISVIKPAPQQTIGLGKESDGLEYNLSHTIGTSDWGHIVIMTNQNLIWGEIFPWN